jgi:hypothetical protein
MDEKLRSITQIYRLGKGILQPDLFQQRKIDLDKLGQKSTGTSQENILQGRSVCGLYGDGS